MRYCRAYDPERLAGYPGVERALAERDERPEVLYLWEDGTVTATPLPGLDVVLSDDSGEWARFRRDELGFEAPETAEEPTPGADGLTAVGERS